MGKNSNKMSKEDAERKAAFDAWHEASDRLDVLRNKLLYTPEYHALMTEVSEKAGLHSLTYQRTPVTIK